MHTALRHGMICGARVLRAVTVKHKTSVKQGARHAKERTPQTKKSQETLLDLAGQLCYHTMLYLGINGQSNLV